MTTFSAIAVIDSLEAAERLASSCEALVPEPVGVGTYEIEDGSGLYEVATYFTESPDRAGLALLSNMHGAREFVISEIPETDWVAKVRRELSPVRAGRFFVYGSHDAENVPEDVVPLLIDASMAFGTGHHGTTLGCLKALDRLIEAGFHPRKTADIGCGTAVLAMAAAKIWPDVTHFASDIDPVAVEVAEANLEANGMGGAISCVEAAGFDTEPLRQAAPFDLVFANILKPPLLMLAPDMARYTAAGGFVILSGLLNDQAEEIITCYTHHGFMLVQSEEIGEWSNLTLRRKS
jgi:ribosomal protein L11 methyltransferase